MNHIFYEVAVIFFAYSFLAWIAETAVATVRVKDFRNRGFASGPFCFVYGFTGVILTVFPSQSTRTEELRISRASGSEIQLSPEAVTIRTRNSRGISQP